LASNNAMPLQEKGWADGAYEDRRKTKKAGFLTSARKIRKIRNGLDDSGKSDSLNKKNDRIVRPKVGRRRGIGEGIRGSNLADVQLAQKESN